MFRGLDDTVQSVDDWYSDVKISKLFIYFSFSLFKVFFIMSKTCDFSLKLSDLLRYACGM